MGNVVLGDATIAAIGAAATVDQQVVAAVEPFASMVHICPEMVVSVAASLILGFAVSFIYRFKSVSTQSFAVTLVLLPALVSIIISLASGNIGVGVAVAGAFSLIRFRSVAGTAREIAHLFFAMSLGFVTGTGHFALAFILLLVMGIASIALTVTNYGAKLEDTRRSLRVKIPENLDFEGLFDDVFNEYTNSIELETIRTAQMGSIYDLKYIVDMKSGANIKAFMDELRVRNGNLSVMMSNKVKTARENGL